MAILDFSSVSLSSTSVVIGVAIATAICLRMVYNLYWHPLAAYPGPWYSSSFSVSLALISCFKLEPQWLQYLVKRYGTSTPIRIQPCLLLFPKASALPEIYWDSKCNQKSSFYGSGALGPPHLFSTLDGDEHRSLRKALAGQPWTLGSLKKNWEPRIDDQVQLFIQKMSERANAKEPVIISDKLAEFAADIMTMFSFTEPFGFVKNSRDEHHILQSFREGLPFFGFACRFKFFRNHIIKIPAVAALLLPKPSDRSGMGWLISEANKQVTQREIAIEQGTYHGKPDFLQHCLEARMDGEPLGAIQKRAHVTLLIQAGADTTGTGLGSTLRFIVANPTILKKARQEIDDADAAGKLSAPVKYEEVRQHLPYFTACIKEGLRLHPPAPNIFTRLVGKEGKTIDGHFIPPGTEITSHAYIVHRDPDVYAPDPESFRPERWLESKEKANELDGASFTFGMGPRVCLGKDIAIMELYKLLPEIVRQFDIELLEKGKFVVLGGVAHNKNFRTQLKLRSPK
ncbi:cytochrome P450, partial [Glonium stellatum]